MSKGKDQNKNNNPLGIQDYPPEEKERLMNYIFERIEKGKSLFDAIKDEFDETKNVIAIKTFYVWKADNMSWTQEYLRVCEVRTDILAEEVIKISDSEHISTKVVETDKGVYMTSYDNTERSRLRINARQWLAGKQQPRKYGNQTEQGEEGHVEQPLFNDID